MFAFAANIGIKQQHCSKKRLFRRNFYHRACNCATTHRPAATHNTSRLRPFQIFSSRTPLPGFEIPDCKPSSDTFCLYRFRPSSQYTGTDTSRRLPGFRAFGPRAVGLPNLRSGPDTSRPFSGLGANSTLPDTCSPAPELRAGTAITAVRHRTAASPPHPSPPPSLTPSAPHSTRYFIRPTPSRCIRRGCPPTTTRNRTKRQTGRIPRMQPVVVNADATIYLFFLS